MAAKFAVGIDLGTTFSCVAVWRKGNVEIIANDQGNRTTPSWVAFTNEENEPLVGEGAKNVADESPESCLFDAKRLIGRHFSESVVQEDRKHWPFKVVDCCGKPYLQAKHRSEFKSFAPEQVSAMVLQKMKRTAETFLGAPVNDVVITCPAYFNDAQRQATLEAGKKAGLNVIRMVHEPTAAALAYGLDKRKGRCNVIVFDFGGGTFDVSLVKMDGNKFDVVCKDGDTHLGGEDLNNILVEHFVNEFRVKFGRDIFKDAESSNADLSKEAKNAIYELRSHCEQAKCTVSTNPKATFKLCYGGKTFAGVLHRPLFERLCKSKFERCITILERLLRDARMTKSEIDDIVLVGGSTRIPCVQDMVKHFFDGKELRQTVNPDEAVAYGAAVQAAVVKGFTPGPDDIGIIEITPMTLGTDIDNGMMSAIIPRNTVIPCAKSHTYTTTVENQSEVHVGVYEGEGTRIADNHLLGEFNLSGIAPAPKGVPVIEVTFYIDANNILRVSAKNMANGKTEQITVERKNEKK